MNLYDADPTLLDLLALPEQIAKDDLIGRMMIDIGESEVCITNPRIMKLAVGAWSRGRLKIWQRLADVMDLEYNPIWNVDGETTHSGNVSGSRTYGRNRTDTETERYSRDRTLEETEKTTGSRNLETEQSETANSETGTLENTTTSGTETTTGQISADNVNTWSNDTKTENVTSGSSQTSGSTETDSTKTATGTEDETSRTDRDLDTSEKIADSRNATGTENISDTEENEGSDSWTERRTGNIGVTTTQKMMTEEVEFWKSYDIINYIINQFAAEFCLLVY